MLMNCEIYTHSTTFTTITVFFSINPFFSNKNILLPKFSPRTKKHKVRIHLPYFFLDNIKKCVTEKEKKRSDRE